MTYNTCPFVLSPSPAGWFVVLFACALILLPSHVELRLVLLNSSQSQSQPSHNRLGDSPRVRHPAAFRLTPGDSWQLMSRVEHRNHRRLGRPGFVLALLFSAHFHCLCFTIRRGNLPDTDKRTNSAVASASHAARQRCRQHLTLPLRCVTFDASKQLFGRNNNFSRPKEFPNKGYPPKP